MELGKFLRNSIRNGNNPYFMIRETNNKLFTQRVTLDSNLIDRMIRQRSYKMKSITLQLSNKLAMSEISLFLNEEEIFPISRFPRSLLEEMDNQESQYCPLFLFFFSVITCFSRLRKSENSQFQLYEMDRPNF